MSMSSISAPVPYYSNHNYSGGGAKGVGRDEAAVLGGRKQHRGGGGGGGGGGGLLPSNIQDSEQQLRGLALRLDEEEEKEVLEPSGGERRGQQQRHNSEGLSPVTRPPLPTAGRSGAHRHLGSNSGVDPWHEHNELPASADATAIGAHFNVYEAAAARGRWEAMALGYDSAASSSSKAGAKASSKKQQPLPREYHQEKPRLFDYTASSGSSTGRSSTHAQARARSASASAAHKKAQQQQQQQQLERSGMPAAFQRTAPKHDKIGAALGACSAGGGPTAAVGGAPPATSNSTGGEAAALVRVAAEGGDRAHSHSRSRAASVSASSSRSSRQQPSIGSSSGSFRQVYDRQPDGSYVRRVDLSSHQTHLDPAMLDARLSSSTTSSSSASSSASASASSSADSSRCVSPLDHSVQTFMRVPAAPVEEQPQQQQQHRAHRSHASTSLSTSAASRGLRPAGLLHTTTSTTPRPAPPTRRLTADVLSPTGSASGHHGHGHHDALSLSLSTSTSVYGARNLATVGCRKSASIVTAATAEAAAGAALDHNSRHHGPAAAPHAHHRHRRTAGGGAASSSSSSSSGLLGRLREGSMEVLARFGIVTPPSPTRHDPPAISVRAHHAARSSSNPHATGPAPLLLLPPTPASSTHAHGHGHGASGSLGSGSGSGSSRQGRVVVYDMAPAHSLPPSLSASGSGSGSGSGKHYHSHGHGHGAPSPQQQHATACVRTALEVITARLQAAQAEGPEATVAEARTFVEGGGVDALLRGLETLGHDPAVAHGLLYTLRVVCRDAAARRAVTGGAKGRMLVERLPAVLRAHAVGGVGPVAADGLAVMAALLDDPVTRRQAAGALLLTPEVLGLVQEILGAVDGASREADACAQILKHGVHVEGGGVGTQRRRAD